VVEESNGMGLDCDAECEGIPNRRKADLGGIMNDMKFEDGYIFRVSPEHGFCLGSLVVRTTRVAVEHEEFLTIDSRIMIRLGNLFAPGDRINGGPSCTGTLESKDSDPPFEVRTGSWSRRQSGTRGDGD
jgi:hypothetical protein